MVDLGCRVDEGLKKYYIESDVSIISTHNVRLVTWLEKLVKSSAGCCPRFKCMSPKSSHVWSGASCLISVISLNMEGSQIGKGCQKVELESAWLSGMVMLSALLVHVTKMKSLFETVNPSSDQGKGKSGRL